MDHPEVLGSASASEVPARPPGSGYNFRPRSRSATAPKNRRLGSVETQGAGSTLDLPTVTPPNSPTPSGAGNPTSNIHTHTRKHANTHFHNNHPRLGDHVESTKFHTDSQHFTVGVSSSYSTLVSHDSTTSSRRLLYSTNVQWSDAWQMPISRVINCWNSLPHAHCRF